MLTLYFVFYFNSCFGCVGSVTIGKESCDGFNACVYMTGLKTVIGDEACGGTTACGGLYSSQVGSYSCLGEGACVRCNSVETCISSGTPGPFTVGLGSCVGCYCCRGVSGKIPLVTALFFAYSHY